jgi:transposase-like protein
MPAKSKRERELAQYGEDEAKPQRCRLFRHAYIATARVLAAAGNVPNAELARHFGVSASTIANWRKQFPDFDRAVELGLADANATIATKAFEMAVDRDPVMVRYWLDRRCDAFKPRNRTVITGTTEALSDMIRRQQLTEEELLADGTLFYGDGNAFVPIIEAPDTADERDDEHASTLVMPRMADVPQPWRNRVAEEVAALRNQGTISD